MKNDDAWSLMQKNGTVVPRIELHPKLMTHRCDSDSHISSARHIPLSSRAALTNAELAYGGVSAQDGVIQQLSARNEKGSLTGPRGMPSSGSPGVRPLTITAARVIHEPLQLSESPQPCTISGTPDHQHPRPPPQEQKGLQQQHQSTCNVSYCGVARPSDGADNSQESVRRSHNSRSSTGRSVSKPSNPYARVTSVLHEYCNNHITALEAQYKVARSHSNAALAYTDEQRRGEIVSPRSTETGYTSGQGQTTARLMSKLQGLSSMLSDNRLNSPRTPAVAEGRRLGGVPRAAFDAPHIRYAKVLNRTNSYRSSSAQRRPHTPSTCSNRKVDFIPEAATRIPDRFKYVPSTEERHLHRVATLSALEEWRERERSTWEAVYNGARAISRNGTPAKSRANTFQQSPPFHPANTSLYASSGSQLQHPDDEKGTVDWCPKRSGHTASCRSGQSWESFTPSPQRRAKTPRKAKRADELRDDQSTNMNAGGWSQVESAREKNSCEPDSRPRNGAASRTPTRENRESAQTSAHAEDDVSTNSFRGKLLFDVAAPIVCL